MAAGRIGHSTGTSMSLTTTYSSVLLGSSATDAESESVPQRALLSYIIGTVTSIASSASAVTFKLTADADGDIPLTDEVTVPILIGQTTATSGAIQALLEFLFSQQSSWDGLYLWAKTNTGTCTLVPCATWQIVR